MNTEPDTGNTQMKFKKMNLYQHEFFVPLCSYQRVLFCEVLFEIPTS